MRLLEARRLEVSLSGRRILDRIDLAIETGTFVGLIGPNGAGKTTLMRALAGLLPYSGEVVIGGRPLAQLSERERALAIAYMAQSRDIAWPLSVEAVVALGRLPHRPPFTGLGAWDREVVDRVIAEMELAELRRRPATELSGGEIARVMMARALAQETCVVIADEPTSGLDPAHQIALMQVFRRLAAAGRSVIASLHELGLAARWCDRLLLVDKGRIVADGAPEQVLTPANLGAVYRIDAYLGHDAGGLLLVPTGLTPTAADP
jgi:iron complex transport system ATP-binding protein